MKAMVFDDDPVVSTYLSRLLRRRGFETDVFADAALCPCPVHEHGTCSQPADRPCADVIVSDVDMPHLDGLNFVKKQLEKGCRCRHIAIISGCWTNSTLDRARQLPITVMSKPAEHTRVDAWLDEVERDLGSRS